jgi:hypothetical protein
MGQLGSDRRSDSISQIQSTWGDWSRWWTHGVIWGTMGFSFWESEHSCLFQLASILPEELLNLFWCLFTCDLSGLLKVFYAHPKILNFSPVSRKYHGLEFFWLWSIDFGFFLLNNDSLPVFDSLALHFEKFNCLIEYLLILFQLKFMTNNKYSVCKGST